MLEIEKISKSQFEKIQDLELDSIDLLNARNVPASTTAIISPYDSVEEGGGKSPSRPRSGCGRRYRSDVQIDGCGMRTSPACSSDCTV